MGKDIDRLVPTAGDAFKMQVGRAEFEERKLAGRRLMKEILKLVQQQEKEVIIATIGGFDLAYQGDRFGKDGYRYEIVLQRTGGDYEIDLAVTTTPIGAISRLEHALGGFEQQRESHRTRLADAQRRLASYTPRLGESFRSEAELERRLTNWRRSKSIWPQPSMNQKRIATKPRERRHFNGHLKRAWSIHIYRL